MVKGSTVTLTATGSYIAQAVNGATATVNVYQYVPPEPTDKATILAAQQHLALLPLDNIPEVAPLPPASRIPFSRNPLFVGRVDKLKKLALTFRQGGSTAIAAVTGLGGFGKTQFAAEFAHHYGQFFQGGVFWLSFALPSNIPAEIAACGGAGYLNSRPDFAQLSLDEQVRLVLSSWQSPLPRLLIFDNCEEEALLATWRPPTGGCRILVTSRRPKWDLALGVQLLPIDVLTRAESIGLLQKFRPDLSMNDTDLDAISNELGDLPLALHLAGNFLKSYQYSQKLGTPKAYLAQLKQAHILEHPSLLGEDSTFSPTGHVQNVARTFGLSYQQLEASDPIDAKSIALLARMSHFAVGEFVPRHLLLSSLQQPEVNLDSALQQEKALTRLITLGLVDEEDQGALRMHRLLTTFVRELSDDSSAQVSVEETLLEVFNQFSSYKNLVEACCLEVHLRSVADLAIPRADQRSVNLCHILGNHLRENSDYEGAKYYLEHALTIYEALLGQDHPDTAIELSDLGYIFYYLGDYAQADTYLRRALPLWEQKKDYANLAATLDNLAQMYDAQGNFEVAYQFYQNALEIREQVLGDTNPLIAITLNNIGGLLLKQGDLDNARKYLERGLEIREQVFKEPNENTAANLLNLGILHQKQGNLATAQQYAERALTIREQVLGPRHTRTLNILSFLVGVLAEQGNLIDAQVYIERVIADSKEMSKSSAIANNFGYSLWVRGDYIKALQYYRSGLDILEHTFGKVHPKLLVTLNNLGMALVSLGDYEAACEYYEQALQIQEHFDHPGEDLTARILNNIGALLRIQGELRSARAYLERALAMRRKMLGETNRDTATTLNNFGLLLQAERNFKEARTYIEHALSIRRQLFGDKHPDVARSLNDLGVLFSAQRNFNEARTYLEQALAIFQQTLLDHPDTAITLTNLSSLAYDQGKVAEAQSCLERALTIYEQRFGTDHSITSSVRDRLTNLSLDSGERMTDSAQTTSQSASRASESNVQSPKATWNSLNLIGNSRVPATKGFRRSPKNRLSRLLYKVLRAFSYLYSRLSLLLASIFRSNRNKP